MPVSHVTDLRIAEYSPGCGWLFPSPGEAVTSVAAWQLYRALGPGSHNADYSVGAIALHSWSFCGNSKPSNWPLFGLVCLCSSVLGFRSSQLFPLSICSLWTVKHCQHMAVFILFQMNLTLNLSLLLLVVVGISCTPHGIRKEFPSLHQVNYLAIFCPGVGFYWDFTIWPDGIQWNYMEVFLAV